MLRVGQISPFIHLLGYNMKYFNTIAAVSFCVLASGITAQAELKMRVETKSGISHHEVVMTTGGSIENGLLSVNGRDLGPAKDISMISFVEDSEYLFVKPEKAGTGDGSSWENAMGTMEFVTLLCKGEADALNGKTFCLAGGNYSLYDVNPDNCRITKDGFNYLPLNFEGADAGVHITLAGGFDPASTGKAVDSYNPGQFVTVFTGDNPSEGTPGSADNKDACGFYIGANACLDISDIKFTCFYAKKGSTFYLHGLTGKHADLNVYNSVFSKLSASDGGGVLIHSNLDNNDDAAFKCVGCTFEEISAEWGAIMKLNSPRGMNYLINCEIKNNTNTNGGLFRMENGDHFFTIGCNFHNNEMKANGNHGCIVSMPWSTVANEYYADACRYFDNHTNTRCMFFASGPKQKWWFNDCYFNDNTADDWWSTLFSMEGSGEMCLNNCTVIDNNPERCAVLAKDCRGIILNSTVLGKIREGIFQVRHCPGVKVANSILLSENGKPALFMNGDNEADANIRLMCNSIVGSKTDGKGTCVCDENSLFGQTWVDGKFTVNKEAGLAEWDGNWEGHTNVTLEELSAMLADTEGYDATAFVEWLKELGAIKVGDDNKIEQMNDATGSPRDPESIWAGAYQK